MRYAELGTVYRYERSGVLHGMLRVRGFTQDDAHIFCTPEQLADEIADVCDLVAKLFSTFGFEYTAYLATKPDEHTIGADEIWERATEALRAAAEKAGLINAAITDRCYLKIAIARMPWNQPHSPANSPRIQRIFTDAQAKNPLKSAISRHIRGEFFYIRGDHETRLF